MAKYTIDIPNYKFVRKRTIGQHEYGENAHLCSCLEFYYSQNKKAGIEDMQTLRDMADNRISYFWNNMYVPLDVSVLTDAKEDGYAYDGDDAECLECGLSGAVCMDGDENENGDNSAHIDWNDFDGL